MKTKSKPVKKTWGVYVTGGVRPKLVFQSDDYDEAHLAYKVQRSKGAASVFLCKVGSFNNTPDPYAGAA